MLEPSVHSHLLRPLRQTMKGIFQVSLHVHLVGVISDRLNLVQINTLMGANEEYLNENYAKDQRMLSGRVSRTASVTSTITGTKTRLSPTVSSQRVEKSPIQAKTITKPSVSKMTSPRARKASSPVSPTRPSSIASTRRISSSISTRSSRKEEQPSGKVSNKRGSRNPTPVHSLSRLPTPDLPSIENPTPLWPCKPAQAGVGLSTPDLDRWFEAGQSKQSQVRDGGGKRVGFAVLNDDGPQEPNTPGSAVSPSPHSNISYDGEGKDSAIGKRVSSPVHRLDTDSESLQVSPRRPTSAADSIPASGVETWMRTLVNDMAYDYRREMKEDIKGLHLDLLRLGRNWKVSRYKHMIEIFCDSLFLQSELRSLMDEYVGDLRELRDENARLRRENERLRGL